MIKIKQAIVVEGKYDKIKLESVVDANIITTDGFGIYNNTEKQALIRLLAEKTGVVIVTDSDGAGKRIRNFIRGVVGAKNITNVYIPKIEGKEKRKSESSKENLLGVEGIDAGTLRDIFKKYGIFAVEDENAEPGKPERTEISRQDFYNDKLSGGENSSFNRAAFCKKIGLPEMRANALLDAVNILMSYGEYKKIITELDFK